MFTIPQNTSSPLPSPSSEPRKWWVMGSIVLLFLLVGGIIMLRTRSIQDGYVIQPVPVSERNKDVVSPQGTSTIPISPTPIYAQDTDGDGVSDADEKRYGTDINQGDTDGDGASDSEELFFKKTDPLKADPRLTRPVFGGDAASPTNP